MRGQGLNVQRFALTSGSQKDYCPIVARIRSRRPSSIRTVTAPNDGLGAVTGRWGRHPLPAVRGTEAPWPRRPARPCADRRVMLPQRARSAPGCAAAHRSALRRQGCPRPARTGAVPALQAQASGHTAAPQAAPCRPQPRTTTRARPKNRPPLTTCSGAKSQAGSASPRTPERHRGQVVTKVKDKEPILVTAPEAARTPPTRGPCQQAPLRGKASSRRCMRTLTRSPLLYFAAVPRPRVFELCL
jgi:hypothetical protein